jgi:TrmH family RNA methyltransferase
MKLASPTVIFVHPKASGNIGALARVLSNFDAAELRLVGKPAVDGQNDAFQDLDWALSCNGKPYLERAKWFPDLKSALEGLHLVIGTSGREDSFEKGYARPLRDPAAVFGEVQARLGKNAELRWALVMGTEDDGLASDEAALCDQLIRIPTSEQNPSMNIAMACGALLYHWRLLQLGVMGGSEEAKGPPFYDPETLRGTKAEVSGKTRWADPTEKEKWIDYLISILDQTQFFKYPDRESVKARIRRWLQATDIPLGELLFAFEVLYQIEAWGTGMFKERNFLGG